MGGRSTDHVKERIFNAGLSQAPSLWRHEACCVGIMKSGDSLRRYNDTGGHCCSAEASCDNTDTNTSTTSLQQPPHSGHGAEVSWLLAQGEARRQGSLVAVWRILALLSCVGLAAGGWCQVLPPWRGLAGCRGRAPPRLISLTLPPASARPAPGPASPISSVLESIVFHNSILH